MNEIKTLAQSWAKNELIPFLDDGEDLLGLPVDRLVLSTLTRRAAASGIDLEFLINEVTYHYNHQLDFIKSHSH